MSPQHPPSRKDRPLLQAPASIKLRYPPQPHPPPPLLLPPLMPDLHHHLQRYLHKILLPSLLRQLRNHQQWLQKKLLSLQVCKRLQMGGCIKHPKPN